MGKIISFINLKGGVGKTTCCVNIAGLLALEGKKVLAIDLDAQGNLSTALLGTARYEDYVIANNSRKPSRSVFQIFLDAINDTEVFNFNDYIIHSAVRFKDSAPLPRLDLLPSYVDLMRLEREIVNYERTKYQILYQNLQHIKHQYDYILIDCPPNIYTATHNALYASEYYIIPTIPDFLSITGLPLLTRTLKKTAEIKNEEKGSDTKLAGVIINLYDKRLNIHKETIDRISETIKELKSENIIAQEAKIFHPYIRNLTDIKKALDEFTPICIYNARSESTAEFRECTHDIIGHLNYHR